MENTITLLEGLEIFQERNRKYFSTKTFSKQGEEFLRCHDIAHVVFGCDTSIIGEGLVKIWTTFGTTLSFWEVTRGYKEVQAFELARKFSLAHVAKNIFRLLFKIPKVIFYSKKMSKPWPFDNYSDYLKIPLSEIRKEFNINIVT